MLGRQWPGGPCREGVGLYQEYHRNHHARRDCRPRNAGTLARQGQACLRQAAKRETPASHEQQSHEKLEISLVPPAQKQVPKPLTVEARCLPLPAKAADAAALAPAIECRPLSRAANEVLIEVKAAAVNPSAIKAATGLMA